jgi:Flp pilus assembly protein TadG
MPRQDVRDERSGGQRWKSRLRAFWTGRKGASFVEFAAVAAPVFLMFFGIIQVGLIFWASFELENATADAARMLRTGQAQTLSAADFKTKICGETFILAGCASKLQISIQTFPGGFSAMTQPIALDSGRNLLTNLNGDPGQVSGATDVLLTAYYPWTLIDPLTSAVLSNMAGGAFLLQEAAAFRSEPF